VHTTNTITIITIIITIITSYQQAVNVRTTNTSTIITTIIITIITSYQQAARTCAQPIPLPLCATNTITIIITIIIVIITSYQQAVRTCAQPIPLPLLSLPLSLSLLLYINRQRERAQNGRRGHASEGGRQHQQKPPYPIARDQGAQLRQ